MSEQAERVTTLSHAMAAYALGYLIAKTGINNNLVLEDFYWWVRLDASRSPTLELGFNVVGEDLLITRVDDQTSKVLDFITGGKDESPVN